MSLLDEKSWIYEKIVVGLMLVSTVSFLVYLVYGWYITQTLVRLYEQYDSLTVVILFHFVLGTLGLMIYILIIKMRSCINRSSNDGAPSHRSGITVISLILLIAILGFLV